MPQTIGGVVDVFIRPAPQVRSLGCRQRAHYFCRGAQHQRAGRNFHALNHQSIRADDGLFSDNRAVKNGCAHAHKNLVANGAGVQDCRMTNRNVIAKNARKVIGEMRTALS